MCPHLTHIDFKLNAIVKNGPVVEPTNFELGIIGDRELGNWGRSYRKELKRDLTSHGAKIKCSYGMEIGAGGILIEFRNSRIRRK